MLSHWHGTSLTRRDRWALTGMVCQAVAETGVSPESMTALRQIQSVFTDREFGGPQKCPRPQESRPWQSAVVPGSCCHSTSTASPCRHPQRGRGSWVYFLFLHSWLIHMEKELPIIKFVFYHSDVLMKLNIYSSEAGRKLLSRSDC